MNIKTMFKGAALGALTFVLSACSPSDPNEPPQYVDAPIPDWAKTIEIVNVAKRSASVKNSQGEIIYLSRSGTNLGNGLIATRDKNDLYIQDKNGVQCNWNSSEHLDWCRKPNPAYLEYKANKQKAEHSPKP